MLFSCSEQTYVKLSKLVLQTSAFLLITGNGSKSQSLLKSFKEKQEQGDMIDNGRIYNNLKLAKIMQITEALTPLYSSLIQGCTPTCFTMDLNNVFKNLKWKFLANESRNNRGRQ